MSRLRSSRAGHVTPYQLVGSLLAFLVLSLVGGVLLSALVLPAVTVAGSATNTAVELFDELPTDLQFDQLPQQSNIYDRHGELIATFYDQNRIVVPLEDISPWLQRAIVAVEDKRFWEHNGVDGEGLLRAVTVNLTSEESQGASTLTQQLIKNTLVQRAHARGDFEAEADATEVSIARKLREARLALALEERRASQYGRTCTPAPEVDCGKESILEQYLNIAQFGASVYGVETASQLYFSKSAREIDALEAATIVGITQNPFKWDPLLHPEAAQERRNIVLLTMLNYDPPMITPQEYAQYTATPIADTLNVNRPKYSCVAAVDAPFFCDYVTKLIARDPVFNDHGDQYLYEGVDIYTTLDLNLQRIANEELRAAISPTDASGFATALVSLDPHTGEILVMAQNKSFDPSAEEPGSTAINYATDREWGGSRGFSPGSTFKPILLTAWLLQGHGLNQVVSADVREWDPQSWHGYCLGPAEFAGQKAYAPTNADEGGGEQMTVLSATAGSVNTAYVAMTNQLDLCAMADTAADLGFHRADGAPFEIVPSATLGTQNASPLTMASIAAVFDNDGVRCEPYAVTRVVDRNGNELEHQSSSCAEVIPQNIARTVVYGMQQVIAYGTGTGMRLKGGRPAAGKTGTAQNNVHGWFMGYTPQLVTVVWEGHPDHDVKQQNIVINGVKYRRVYGATIAGATWKRYMDRALEGQPVLNFPAGPPGGVGGWSLPVPNVIGQLEIDAKHAINDAGYAWEVDPVRYYDESFENGAVWYQTPDEGAEPGSGATVRIGLTRDTLPDWWFTWPSGWNPCKAPSDWWGSGWPPTGPFSPTGWSYAGCNNPNPNPTPTPTP